MKTIVALIDFSDVTAQVVQHAQALAGAFQSHVILLHVVPPQPEAVDLGIVSPVIMRNSTTEEWAAHHAKLLLLRESLAGSGIRVTAEQAPGATSLENLLAETVKLNADLIILGSHHHGFLYDLLVGSVAHKVLKHAHCPVLVIPAEQPSSAA